MIDEWIQLALEEYEQIASLCNAQSTLGNAVAAASSSSSSPPLVDHVDSHYDGRRHGHDRDLDPKTLNMELQQTSLHDKLSEYYQAIDVVRKTHASLKAQLSSMSQTQAGDIAQASNEEERFAGRRRRASSSAVSDAFCSHIELSERVIRTVMMQSSPHNKHGPCGILFQNGIVRTSSSADGHEANIVALASLRASVSQLKTNYGEGG